MCFHPVHELGYHQMIPVTWWARTWHTESMIVDFLFGANRTRVRKQWVKLLWRNMHIEIGLNHLKLDCISLLKSMYSVQDITWMRALWMHLAKWIPALGYIETATHSFWFSWMALGQVAHIGTQPSGILDCVLAGNIANGAWEFTNSFYE